MSPQMGEYTQEDANADIAAHNALTIVHGTVDDVADQTDIENHRLDADAHHSEEIPEGRGVGAGVTYLKIPGDYPTLGTTLALTDDNIWYFPIIVKTPITIDQVVVEITAAAGAGEQALFAIYHADINWQPLALVVASAAFAIDGAAVVSTALAATVLQEGRYLMALILEGDATFRAAWYCHPILGFVPTMGVGFFLQLVYVAQAYGALPDPGTVWNLRGTGANSLSRPCFLRVTVP